MKHCRNKNCSQPNPQPSSKFNKRQGLSDGLQPYCRVCQSQANARNRKKRSRPNTPMMAAHRKIRGLVRQGRMSTTPCQHDDCSSVAVRLFLSSPDAKPKWFCQLHHPNRSGNRTLRIEVPDEES